MVWADLLDPTPDSLGQLANELGLSRWAIEDSLADAERVKASTYSNHTFISVYAVGFDVSSGSRDPVSWGGLRKQRISIFIRANVIVTVRLSDPIISATTGTVAQFGAGARVTDIEALIHRLDELGGYQLGVGMLLHGLLDVVVDSHFEAIGQLDEVLDSLEQQVFDTKTNPRVLQRSTYTIRKDLVALRRVVLPMSDVVELLERHRDVLKAPEALRARYEDLYDHITRAAEWVDSMQEMVVTVFETNASLQDARLNEVMKRLTAFTAIIAVPTAITGFYGQNVPFPGSGATSGFVTSTVLLVSAMSLFYVLFRRNGWL
ncbi:magnesium transporter CorA family protein [Williamsia sp. CHRR-6]|nr:magnesium transporter CorA family protein [Williamsia sp. CHRR-6]